jgi:ATP-dependent Clp endopeptidase proteolytic subunit ClpP
MIRRIRKLLEEMAEGEGPEGISLADLASAASSREPDMRIVGLFSEVIDEKVAEIVHAMLYMNELNKGIKDPKNKRDIEFYLSTYGGSADDMFALYDMMKVIQETTDISTIGMGKVMSAGVLILAGGTQGKRKIGRNCRVMLHSVVAGNQGSLHNLINEMEAIQDLQEMYIDRLVEETKMTKKQLKKMLEQKVNIYLSAEQAVEYGIADEII